MSAADLIIDVLPGLGADVDHESRPDHLLDRNLVGSIGALGEVHRRVEMRAAMLGRREVVGAVIVSARGMAGRDLLQLEHVGRGPVDGPGVERMGQVDPPTGRKILRKDGKGTEHDRRGRGGGKGLGEPRSVSPVGAGAPATESTMPRKRRPGDSDLPSAKAPLARPAPQVRGRKRPTPAFSYRPIRRLLGTTSACPGPAPRRGRGHPQRPVSVSAVAV